MSRILVIDDEVGFRVAARTSLREIHAEVLEAADAASGLGLARSQQPDLILCDLNLGSGSGLDVLNGLRQAPETAAIPLIQVTASDDTSIMRRCMELGADDFLHKPFTSEELLAAVRARLKKLETVKAQAERALRDIEARHRLLFESSVDAVMVLSPTTWRFVEANAATLRMFGARTKAEFLAAGPWDVSPEQQSDGVRSAERAKTMIETALRDGSHHFEWMHRRFTGEVFPATVLLARMELAGQTVLQATVRDVTEQKRTELLLRARAELAEIAARSSLDELLQAALDRAEQLTGSCIGFFHFVDTDQQSLTLQTWSSNTLQKMCKAEGKGRHYPVSQAGVWVDCIRTRTPVIHNDYASLPHRKGLPPGHAPVVRQAVVPILRNGLVVCLLGVGNKPTDYTAEDVRRLEDLASIGADYAIRLRAEQALQESERRYQTLAETSPAGVFRTDADGQTTYVNTRWCQLAGLSREQALGEGWLRAIHPEDREAVVQDWVEARAKEQPVRADYRFVRPDGAIAWVMGQAAPERNAGGQLLGYVGTVTDITQRKLAEAALQEREELLQEVGAIAQIGGWEMDLVTRKAKWTRTTYDLIGLKPGDPIPGPDEHVAYYVEEDRPKVAEAMRALIEDDVPLDFDARINIPAKGLRWFRAVGRAVRKDGRCLRVYGTLKDITGRKQAEAALVESEARCRAIATTAPDAILLIDTNFRVEFWNPAAERIFGFTETEALGADVLQLIAPEDVRPAYQDVLEGLWVEGEESGTNRTLDVRALRKDGAAFDAELALSAVVLNGRRHAVAIVRDVTQQKDTTQQLMQERILLRTLMDALPDCIYAKDREARKTLANQADVRSLGGKTEADILGKTDYEMLERKVAAACYADDMHVITHGKSVINRQELIANSRGEQRWLETTKLPLRDGLGNVVGLVGIGHDITERRRVEDQLRKLSKAVEQSPASVVITDTAGRIEYVNPKFCALTGYSPEEVLGQNPRALKSGETPAAEYARLWRSITSGQEWRGEFHNRKKNGELYWEFAVISPIKDDAGNITHFLAVKEDITERKRTEGERNVMEMHLRQAQKLESIGQLAAGIAHEINTPMQYIGDNTRFLQDAFGDLRRVVGAFQEFTKQIHDQPGMSEALAPVETVLQAADVDYVLEEIPKAIEQSLQGAERVTKIVRAMKEFSHPGSEQKTAVDLNHAIDSTITVARNEWKYVANLETDFDPQLPPVPCLPGEFNQVILNLIINAAHAIADVVGKDSGKQGRITIRTRRQDKQAEVRIEDTGTGIPEAVRGRIFDPFFTTKPVGKGSGQGLAIARSVIVDKHGGTLTFQTEMGRGTAFIIRLPLTATESEPTPQHP